MGVTFGTDGKAIISWKGVEDKLEPTASPKGYILYTRISDGAFDNGIILNNITKTDGRCFAQVNIQPGQIMSFKVAAFNDGGISFPSEIVSIGVPASESVVPKVLVVNNFDRVSGPAFIDTPTYAGFEDRIDSGVPDRRDITFIGEMYNFRRGEEWISNDRPGFGATHSDKAGEVVAGNSFDYAAVHGKAILAAGYAFYSCSNERFSSDSTFRAGAWAVDMICGKQVTTSLGKQQKYTVFDSEMQKAISDFCNKGGNILVSGSYIGTDIWDNIYPVEFDDTFRAESVKFATEILGYEYATGQASRRGKASPVRNAVIGNLPDISLVMEKNPYVYCVESPDGIQPASKTSSGIYRYSDSGVCAGVAYEGKGYKSVSLGFPIEALEDYQMIEDIMVNTLKYFTFAENK
jgi:hypothetical protein